MENTEKTVFMNMCMVCDGNRVVVIDRKKQDWPGITFPGGHIEPEEAFADSVIREIWEETGLTIKSPELRGITDWCDNGCRYVVFLYRATSFTGELASSDEGEVWWEEIGNLSGLKLTYGMEDYLRVFSENDLSELYYRKADKGWINELK